MVKGIKHPDPPRPDPRFSGVTPTNPMLKLQCEGCGCTETSPCQTETGPCRWVSVDPALCSGCA